MRALFFGTYEAHRHARVPVLMEGLRAHGDEIHECNVPLGLGTAARVRLLRQPWRVPALGAWLAGSWPRLRRCARRAPAPDAVVVGYMGHFDVHLARRVFPDTTLVLDHMISAADTARDRGIASRRLLKLLDRVDRAAVARPEIVMVDTEEHMGLLPPDARRRAVVVPLAAPGAWYREPGRTPDGGPLRVVFFGTFTPLQGAVTIARAVAKLADAPIDFALYGSGQDHEEARTIARGNPNVDWGWVELEELRERVAVADVCLGIFGTSAKARRVVPNKVYQGAAAGCAIVTSDTPPQRRAFDGAAVFVPPGNADALAAALTALAGDRDRVRTLRRAAAARSREAFAPDVVVKPLRERIAAA